MSLPASLRDQLALPVIGSPLFIVSNPELVIAQCQAGIVGAFPALNARAADPDNLPSADKSTMKVGSGRSSKSKAWRDIWGAGQGAGNIEHVASVREVIEQLGREYREALSWCLERAAKRKDPSAASPG